jgi:hypothetical protein
MASEDIFQGASEELKLVIKDQSGTAINITALDVSFTVLLLEKMSSIVAKWKYPTTAGFGAIEVFSVQTGEYIIRLNASQTSSFKSGNCLIEFKLVEPNDDFESNQQVTIQRVEFGNIKETSINQV